jgi:hypothetical protein
VDRRQSAEFSSSETKSLVPAKPVARKPANPTPGVSPLLPEQKGSSPLGQEAATSPPGKEASPSSTVSGSAAQSSGAKAGGDLQKGTSGGVPAAFGTERKAAGILPAPEKKGTLVVRPGPKHRSLAEDIAKAVDGGESGSQKEGGGSTAINQGNATGSPANEVNEEDAAVSSKETAVDNAKGAEGANRAVEGVVRGAVMGQDKGPASAKGESVLGPSGRSGSEKGQNGPAPATAVARPSGSKSKLSVSAPPFVPKSMQFSKAPASSDSNREAAKQVKQTGLTNLSTATEARSVDSGIPQGVRRSLSSGPLAPSPDRIVVTPVKRERAAGKPPSKAAMAVGPTSGTPPSLPLSKAPQQVRSGNPPSVGSTPLAVPQKALVENGRQDVSRNSSTETANKHIDLVVGTIRVPHLDMVSAGVVPSRVSLVVGKGRPSRETRQPVVFKDSTSADAATGKGSTGAQAGQVASKESEGQPSKAKERVDRSSESGQSMASGRPATERQPEVSGGMKGAAEGEPPASDDVSRALADAPPRGPESSSSTAALEGSEAEKRVPPKPDLLEGGTFDPKAEEVSGAGSGGSSTEKEQPVDPSPSPELLATESGKVGRKSKPRRLSLVARQQAPKVPKQTGGGVLEKPAGAQHKKKPTGGLADSSERVGDSKEGFTPSEGGVDRVAENGAILKTDGLGRAELREAQTNCSGVALDDSTGSRKVTSEENVPVIEQRGQEANPDPGQRDSRESNVEEPRKLETACEPADVAVMLSPEDSTESAGVGGSGKGDSSGGEQEGAAEGGGEENQSGETGGSNAGEGNQGGAGNGDGGEERDGRERGGEKKGGNDATKKGMNRKEENERKLGGEEAHEVENAEGIKSTRIDAKEGKSNSPKGSFSGASKDLVVAEEESSKEGGEVAGRRSPQQDEGSGGGLPHPEEWGDVNEDRSIFRQRLWSYLFEVSFK